MYVRMSRVYVVSKEIFLKPLLYNTMYEMNINVCQFEILFFRFPPLLPEKAYLISTVRKLSTISMHTV